MTSATEYLGIAGLLMLSARDTKYPVDRAELAQLFETVYEWKCDENATDRIVRQLDAWGAIIVHEDKFAGETFRIFNDNLRDARALIRGSKLNGILSSADYGGAPWFKRVFSHQEFWNEVYSERDQPIKKDPEPIRIALDDDGDQIPASDRIVARSDNSEALDEIVDTLDSISVALHEDNEVGSELGDLREVIDHEIEVARQVVERPRFRHSSLVGWLTPMLKFLADKFAGGAIADAAKRLLELLIALV